MRHARRFRGPAGPGGVEGGCRQGYVAHRSRRRSAAGRGGGPGQLVGGERPAGLAAPDPTTVHAHGPGAAVAAGGQRPGGAGDRRGQGRAGRSPPAAGDCRPQPRDPERFGSESRSGVSGATGRLARVVRDPGPATAPGRDLSRRGATGGCGHLVSPVRRRGRGRLDRCGRIADRGRGQSGEDRHRHDRLGLAGAPAAGRRAALRSQPAPSQRRHLRRLDSASARRTARRTEPRGSHPAAVRKVDGGSDRRKPGHRPAATGHLPGHLRARYGRYGSGAPHPGGRPQAGDLQFSWRRPRRVPLSPAA